MKLASTTWGRGETRALFLHGFTGSRHSFDHLEPLLGDLLTATCVELPGHGETPALSWDETVEAIGAGLPLPAKESGAEALDFINRFPRAESRGFFASANSDSSKEPSTPRSPKRGEGGSVLIGYSQGARLALAVAERFPDLVQHLVLESCAAGFRRRHDRVLRRQSDEELAQQLDTHGVDAFVRHWERLPLFDGLRALPVAEQQALRGRRGSHTAGGLASALRLLGQGAQPDLWPALQRLRVPTLLMTGADDVKYTRLARKMANDLPLAWRVSFAGTGHAPHLECPAAYAAELRSFLAPRWLSEPQGLAP